MDVMSSDVVMMLWRSVTQVRVTVTLLDLS